MSCGLLIQPLSAFAYPGGLGLQAFGVWRTCCLPSGQALSVVQFILISLFALVAAYLVGHKRRIAGKIRQFADSDPAWEIGSLKQRIRQVFTAYQSAEQENEPLIARRFLTADLLKAIDKIATERLMQSVKIYSEHSEIQGMAFLSAHRSPVGGEERFWVVLTCSMTRYRADDDTGVDIVSHTSIPETYHVLCKFVRTEDGWLADRIMPYRCVTDIPALFPGVSR